MRKYIIRKEFTNEYVTRETNKKMKFLLIALSIFIILMFFFTYSYGVHKILMPLLGIFYLIFFVLVYISILSQSNDMADSTFFVFSDESISRLLDKEKLNLMTKVSTSINELRYGIKFNQTIKFNEIESTSINANEIIIKSIHYDFFSSNGKISIPKEIEDYEAIKSEIIKNSNKYNLILPNTSNPCTTPENKS